MKMKKIGLALLLLVGGVLVLQTTTATSAMDHTSGDEAVEPNQVDNEEDDGILEIDWDSRDRRTPDGYLKGARGHSNEDSEIPVPSGQINTDWVASGETEMDQTDVERDRLKGPSWLRFPEFHPGFRKMA